MVLVVFLSIIPVLFPMTTVHPSTPTSPYGFALGAPSSERCPLTYTYQANGCSGGDYTYELVFEESTISFGNVEFKVTNSSGNLVKVLGSGGFSIVSRTMSVQAQSTPGSLLSMSTEWSVYGPGTSGSTPLTDLDSLLLDFGMTNASGLGDIVTAIETGAYAGGIAAQTLP